MKALGYTFYAFCGLVSAFFVTWVLMAQLNFAYPALYDFMEIEDHVQKYGPQNRYRRAFHKTDKPEHERLFAQINTSIHNHGAGLEEITYHTPSGQAIDVMLRREEVVHLQDVSILVDAFRVAGLICLFIWTLVTAIHITRRRSLPSVKVQTLSILALSLASTAAVFAIGPVTVFYAFHEWLFPENHQWFFYYQESLMTILMKAPYLFGWIALILVSITIPLYIFVTYIAGRLTQSQLIKKETTQSA